MEAMLAKGRKMDQWNEMQGDFLWAQVHSQDSLCKITDKILPENTPQILISSTPTRRVQTSISNPGLPY